MRTADSRITSSVAVGPMRIGQHCLNTEDSPPDAMTYLRDIRLVHGDLHGVTRLLAPIQKVN